MEDDNLKGKVLKSTYIISPQWGALFFIIGGAFLLLTGIPVRFLLDLSASSDRVFSIEALISGIGVELVFRRFLRRKLVVAPKLEIPFIYLWPLLCLYVFIATPFE